MDTKIEIKNGEREWNRDQRYRMEKYSRMEQRYRMEKQNRIEIEDREIEIGDLQKESINV